MARLNRYLLLFDEINSFIPILFLNKEKAKDEFIDYLLDAYLEGFIGCEEMLDGINLEPIRERIDEALTKSYDGETIYQKLANYIETDNVDELKRLIDSEVHRVYNQGVIDYGELYQAESGSKIKKTWVTMGDKKVRDTHAYLDSLTIDLGAEFITFDGDKALAPGGFKLAQNNANCRCWLVLTSE